MPTTITDENGNEQEVYTAEEVEAQKQEAVQAKEIELNAQVEEANKKVENLNFQLEEAQKGGNPHQIQRLKDAKAKAEEEAQSAKSEADQKFESFIQEQVKEHRDNALAVLSGGDEELRKKIEYHMDNTIAGNPTTKGGIEDKAKKAYTLATEGQAAPSILDNITSASDKGNSSTDSGGNYVETEVSKGQRKALGISDDDAKKYGPKLRYGNINQNNEN